MLNLTSLKNIIGSQLKKEIKYVARSDIILSCSDIYCNPFS
jgi:hypothetical protein